VDQASGARARLEMSVHEAKTRRQAGLGEAAPSRHRVRILPDRASLARSLRTTRNTWRAFRKTNSVQSNGANRYRRGSVARSVPA
jgi:hypothetical protein